MNIPKDNSSLRYFLASFKPLGRFMFWGPLGFLALALLFYWQIQQNPQWISPITEEPPTNPEAEILPGQARTSTPQALQQPQASPRGDKEHWASEYQERLSQEQLQPVSIDQPDQRKKAQDYNPLPQSNQKTSSLFMPLLPSVQSNSGTKYNPVKPLQIQSVPVTENQLQKAMQQSGLNTPAPTSGYSRSNNPYYPNAAAPTTGQASIAPNTSAYGANPLGTGTQPYSNYAPNPPLNSPPVTYPNYGNTPVSGSQYPAAAPNSPYSQPPAPRGAQIQPSIQAAPAGY